MSFKISVGLQQVGAADCGSLGASCQVEFDVDGSLLEHEPSHRQQQMAQAFAVCQQAINQRLTKQSDPVACPIHHGHSEPVSRLSEPAPSKEITHRVEQITAPATPSQIRAIFGIAKKQGVDPLKLAHERFGVDRPDSLSIRQASALIDELKRGVVELRS